MGGVWAGQAPGMKNPKLYENFIAAQIKVLLCIFFKNFPIH